MASEAPSTTQSDVVKVAKTTVAKKKDHPPYADMVVASISALADRKGSSRAAIVKYVLRNYNVGDDSKKVNMYVCANLTKGIDSRLLDRVSGVGVSGRFRLGVAAKAAANKAKKSITKAPKKVAKKETTTSKLPKKDAEKTTTSRSPKKAATAKSLKVVGKDTGVEKKKTTTTKKSTVKAAKSDSATLKVKSPKKATVKSTKMAKSDSATSKTKSPKKATVKSAKMAKSDAATSKAKSPKKVTVKLAKTAKGDSSTLKAKSPKKVTVKLPKMTKASTKEA